MVIALLGVFPWFATLATATEIQLSSLAKIQKLGDQGLS